MFAARVEARAILRLDAEYYDPLALAEDAKVRLLPHETFGDLVAEGYRVVYHGVDDADASGGVPFLSPTDISDDGEYEVDRIGVRLPAYYVTRYPKGVARPGELLIEVKGNTSKVAVVRVGAHEHMLVSGSLYKAALHSRADSHFVLAFLRSRAGNILKRRVVSNINISYLGKDDLYGIPVPQPSTTVQRYIGSKVRQAEALRARVSALANDVDRAYAQVELLLPSETRRHARIRPEALRDRLDAGHYPDAVVRAFASWQGDVASLGSLSADIFSGTSLPEAEVGVQQATVATLDSVFLKDRCRTVRAARGAGRPFATHDLALAAAAHTANFIGKDVTYVVTDSALFPSTEVLVVRPDRTRVPSSWVWSFLRSPLGYRQIQACVRGITAHAYQDDLREVLVALPPKAVVAAFREFDVQLMRANAAWRAARALVTASRLLVEALIERRVGEAELIAAATDAAADRALLARLTTSGLDAPGQPLFPDLDAVVALVADGVAGGAP